MTPLPCLGHQTSLPTSPGHCRPHNLHRFSLSSSVSIAGRATHQRLPSHHHTKTFILFCEGGIFLPIHFLVKFLPFLELLLQVHDNFSCSDSVVMCSESAPILWFDVGAWSAQSVSGRSCGTKKIQFLKSAIRQNLADLLTFVTVMCPVYTGPEWCALLDKLVNQAGGSSRNHLAAS